MDSTTKLWRLPGLEGPRSGEKERNRKEVAPESYSTWDLIGLSAIPR